jgi:hypothetical protein
MSERYAVTRMLGVVGCICAALALAGAARGALLIGVTEDAGKNGDAGTAFYNTLADLGLTQNRISINWDPTQPDAIPAQPEIVSWLPQALTAGTRIVFAVAPLHKRDLTSSPAAPAKFAAFLQQVALAFPQVKDYVIGNEPNQPYFWLPQFNPKGKPVSAAAYEPVLARAYDALKAVDPTINVIGIGLSPRGNDNPRAPNNISRSPVRFLKELGAAYRASHRAKPLMDQLGFHPYPHSSADSIATGYIWPNAGMVNLGRIKQAVWDAFHGTAQPTFAEPGLKLRTSSKPLTFALDEVGWQVAVEPDLAGLYFGTEPDRTTDEVTQARIYGSLIKRAECDASVTSLSFFHLADEADLGRWQSGLERADGTHRPSYEAVKETIAQTHGLCQGQQVRWTHATKVVSPKVSWNARRTRSSKNRNWSFVAGAGEEASYRVGLFKYGLTKAAMGRFLARGRPAPALKSSGMIKSKSRVVYLPARPLKPGRYVYAIRMVSTMNPQRSSLLVGGALRVVGPPAPRKRH